VKQRNFFNLHHFVIQYLAINCIKRIKIRFLLYCKKKKKKNVTCPKVKKDQRRNSEIFNVSKSRVLLCAIVIFRLQWANVNVLVCDFAERPPSFKRDTVPIIFETDLSGRWEPGMHFSPAAPRDSREIMLIE